MLCHVGGGGGLRLKVWCLVLSFCVGLSYGGTATSFMTDIRTTASPGLHDQLHTPHAHVTYVSLTGDGVWGWGGSYSLMSH